jgi:SAM-dependent methyltransferase
VFVLPVDFPSAEDEKAVYELHENSPGDPGYRKFLSRLFEPMAECILPASRGLDFGCGPGPALSLMFGERGHRMAVFDPFFAPDSSVLDIEYDFVTATEVIEHLHRPKETLERMWSCVKPGGYLGLMTQLVIDQSAFSRWRYTHDATHVCFYTRKTFEWLGEHWQATPQFEASNVIILQKPRSR